MQEVVCGIIEADGCHMSKACISLNDAVPFYEGWPSEQGSIGTYRNRQDEQGRVLKTVCVRYDPADTFKHAE